MFFEVSKMVNIYDNVIEVCDVFNKTRNSILLLVLFCLQIRTLFNLSPNSAICNVIQSKCVLHVLEYLGAENEMCLVNFVLYVVHSIRYQIVSKDTLLA